MKNRDIKIWSLPIDKDHAYIDIQEYVRFKTERSWYATITRQNGYYHLRLDVFDSKLLEAIFSGDM